MPQVKTITVVKDTYEKYGPLMRVPDVLSMRVTEIELLRERYTGFLYTMYNLPYCYCVATRFTLGAAAVRMVVFGPGYHQSSTNIKGSLYLPRARYEDISTYMSTNEQMAVDQKTMLVLSNVIGLCTELLRQVPDLDFGLKLGTGKYLYQ